MATNNQAINNQPNPEGGYEEDDEDIHIRITLTPEQALRFNEAMKKPCVVDLYGKIEYFNLLNNDRLITFTQAYENRMPLLQYIWKVYDEVIQ
jgi:hypothetical protein